MSKFIAYCKIGCPHSNATNEFLTNLSSNSDHKVKIISVNTDYFSIISIGNVSFNSKEDFFKYVASKERVDLDNHKTFPVNIFESSDGIKHFIGGNDKLQKIYSLAQNTSSVSKSKPHQECVSNANGLESDGQKRFYCYFLKVLKKITN